MKKTLFLSLVLILISCVKEVETPKAAVVSARIEASKIGIEILKKYGVKKFVIVTGFKNNYFKRLESKNIVLKKNLVLKQIYTPQKTTKSYVFMILI